MKPELRKYFRKVRQDISLKQRENCAHLAALLFSKQVLFQESEHIACYLPLKNEFDSKQIIELIWESKKNCYLPVVKKNSLVFVPFNREDKLQLNRYSILEPINIEPAIPLTQLNIVVLPLVAFDARGHRLGAGGGYYDRTFGTLNKKPVSVQAPLMTSQPSGCEGDLDKDFQEKAEHTQTYVSNFPENLCSKMPADGRARTKPEHLQKPLLLGLAYAGQQAESLPVDAWDVSLDGVLTEKEFIIIKNN